MTAHQPAHREGRGRHRGDKPATWFVYKPFWFVLSQTEGQPLPEPSVPTWDRSKALAALQVDELPFDLTDGNVLGFARGRSIAINPVNPLPHKTRLHELAHVLLGHTSEGEQSDGELTPRNIREVEAESVALLCCAALGLPGTEYSRGYIQSWWGQGDPIPEKSAQRILKAADQILRAGRDDHLRGGRGLQGRMDERQRPDRETRSIVEHQPGVC